MNPAVCPLHVEPLTRPGWRGVIRVGFLERRHQKQVLKSEQELEGVREG